MREIFKNKGIKWENIYYEKDEDTIIIKIYKKETGEEYNVLIDKEDFDLVKPHIWRVKIKRKDTKLKNIPSIAASIKPIGKSRHYDYQIYQLILDTKHKDIIVDHENMNRFDNRKCNLRIVTPKENRLNQEFNGFRYDGIYYYPSFAIDRIEFDLGRFNTKEEAMSVFLKACLISGRDKISIDIRNKLKKFKIVLNEEDLYEYGLYDVYMYVTNKVIPDKKTNIKTKKVTVDKTNIKTKKVTVDKINNNDNKVNKSVPYKKFNNKIREGVSFCKQTKKWLVRVVIKDRLYNMGRYKDLEYAKYIYKEILNALDNDLKTSENKYIQKAIDIKEGIYDPEKYNGRKNNFYEEHKKEIIELIEQGNTYYKTTTILKERYPDTKIKSDTLKSRYLKWINDENK